MSGILIASLVYCCAYGQIINNPMAGREAGHTYYRWVVDVNHDGKKELLIGEKATKEDNQLEEQIAKGGYVQPNVQGFGVYIPLKSGGYINSKHVESTEGDFVSGIGIDLSHCYVGYIDEIKGYGIVSLEITEVKTPNARELKKQVYCYTITGDHMLKTDLTPVMDADAPSSIYNKYLSESKRTKVRLEEVTPEWH